MFASLAIRVYVDSSVINHRTLTATVPSAVLESVAEQAHLIS